MCRIFTLVISFMCRIFNLCMPDNDESNTNDPKEDEFSNPSHVLAAKSNNTHFNSRKKIFSKGGYPNRQYQRFNNQNSGSGPSNNRSNKNNWCTHCGGGGHGSSFRDRSKNCPAFNAQCNKCEGWRHFAKVCQKIREESKDIDARNEHFAPLIAEITLNLKTVVSEIPVCMTPMPTLPSPKHNTVLSVFPDSGAGICLANYKHMKQLGLTFYQLNSCNKPVIAVGGSKLICKHWILVRFEIANNITIQPLYFCQQVDKIY